MVKQRSQLGLVSKKRGSNPETNAEKGGISSARLMAVITKKGTLEFKDVVVRMSYFVPGDRQEHYAGPRIFPFPEDKSYGDFPWKQEKNRITAVYERVGDDFEYVDQNGDYIPPSFAQRLEEFVHKIYIEESIKDIFRHPKIS